MARVLGARYWQSNLSIELDFFFGFFFEPLRSRKDALWWRLAPTSLGESPIERPEPRGRGLIGTAYTASSVEGGSGGAWHGSVNGTAYTASSVGGGSSDAWHGSVNGTAYTASSFRMLQPPPPTMPAAGATTAGSLALLLPATLPIGKRRWFACASPEVTAGALALLLPAILTKPRWFAGCCGLAGPTWPLPPPLPLLPLKLT
jgi:hypothetical protein